MFGFRGGARKLRLWCVFLLGLCVRWVLIRSVFGVVPWVLSLGLGGLCTVKCMLPLFSGVFKFLFSPWKPLLSMGRSWVKKKKGGGYEFYLRKLQCFNIEEFIALWVL